MMETEELIRALRYCGNHGDCIECDFDCEGEMEMMMLIAADRLEQLEKELESVKAERNVAIKQGEWIPVESEPTEPDYFAEYEFVITSPLPDFGQEILVTDGKSVWCDTFYDDDGCYTDGGYNFGTDIIAWMPLPYIPKEWEQYDKS